MLPRLKSTSRLRVVRWPFFTLARSLAFAADAWMKALLGSEAVAGTTMEEAIVRTSTRFTFRLKTVYFPNLNSEKENKKINGGKSGTFLPNLYN